MTTEIKIDEKTKVDLEIPSMWKVVFLNDDHTPMEFVIDVLQSIFKHSESKAKEITLEIHETGSAIAGVYAYEIAEHKGLQVTHLARSHSFPLQINIEKE
jgi:ATP-dependent Clp protease adaptor protein ClpS